MSGTKTNALVIFANPRGTDSLRLGTEDRAIKEAIKLSQHRRSITLTTHHAATIHDLRRALLEKKTCRILQISGHGTGVGLLLEDEMGGRYIVPQAALADLFRAYSPPKGSLECVILNACYSLAQGKLTSLGVPYTIAMEGSISDNASTEFSRGFYDAIGAGYDIERAYDEGVLAVGLAASGAKWASRLLKKGEEVIAENSMPTTGDAESSLRGTEPRQNSSGLLGLAIDLSGSMAGSIRNNTGGHLTRLESFQQSLKRLAQGARKTLQKEQTRGRETSIDMFAYGFGLRGLSVCDLLSLMEVGKHVISKEEIEQLKKDYTRQMQQKAEQDYGRYKGFGALARNLGFGELVNDAESVIRRQAEAEIRRKIMLEVKRRLEQQLSSVGDTTLSIEEVATLLSTGGETFANAEELVYGDTPMCEALTKVTQRFERELATRSKETIPVLFILSDGEPTDCSDPGSIVEALKALGIIIVSCFVTDQDIANPRTLLGSADPQWSRGARLMFDMASDAQVDFQYANFLLKKGWTIYPEAKLFVQLNHSEILEEFIQVIVSPLEERMTQDPLPRGM